MSDYTVLYYEIYTMPKSPTANGDYYGKTPVLEQAQAVVVNAKQGGILLFIKTVCSDGMKRYL